MYVLTPPQVSGQVHWCLGNDPSFFYENIANTGYTSAGLAAVPFRSPCGRGSDYLHTNCGAGVALFGAYRYI